VWEGRKREEEHGLTKPKLEIGKKLELVDGCQKRLAEINKKPNKLFEKFVYGVFEE
jgi:hypothetical protein